VESGVDDSGLTDVSTVDSWTWSGLLLPSLMSPEKILNQGNNFGKLQHLNSCDLKARLSASKNESNWPTETETSPL